MFGNFIADSVRSSQLKNYSRAVVQGIKLHQLIDEFTDHHPIVMESKERLRPQQGKYSPVVIDILYDHFLAANFSDYSKVPLVPFAKEAYIFLQSRAHEFPPTVKRMFPYMKKHNWLVNYANREGLESVLNGMSRRAKFENRMGESVEMLYTHYALFEKEFKAFYPLLKQRVDQEMALFSSADKA